MAKSWTISGVSEQTREAVTAAAQEAEMSIGAWIEQALGKALEEGLEPGVSIEEIEARVRQVVTDELQLVQQILTRLEAAATAPASTPPADSGSSSPISLVRERMRQRRWGR